MAVVHISHRGKSILVSRPYFWQLKCGIYSVGNVFFGVCAYSNRKIVRFCLPILSVCNTNAAVILEFVYSEVWEEKCLDKRMVGSFLPLSVKKQDVLRGMGLLLGLDSSVCDEAVKVVDTAGALHGRGRHSVLHSESTEQEQL